MLHRICEIRRHSYHIFNESWTIFNTIAYNNTKNPFTDQFNVPNGRPMCICRNVSFCCIGSWKPVIAKDKFHLNTNHYMHWYPDKIPRHSISPTYLHYPNGFAILASDQSGIKESSFNVHASTNYMSKYQPPSNKTRNIIIIQFIH